MSEQEMHLTTLYQSKVLIYFVFLSFVPAEVALFYVLFSNFVTLCGSVSVFWDTHGSVEAAVHDAAPRSP